MAGGEIEVASYDWKPSSNKLRYVCTYEGTPVIIYIADIEELSPSYAIFIIT